jgi:hypothetical protein
MGEDRSISLGGNGPPPQLCYGVGLGVRAGQPPDLYSFSLGGCAIVDLEDWECAWVPPVPIGKRYLSFPVEDEVEVDPKTRDVAQFIASLISSGRTVLVHCAEGLHRSGLPEATPAQILHLRPGFGALAVYSGFSPDVDERRVRSIAQACSPRRVPKRSRCLATHW